MGTHVSLARVTHAADTAVRNLCFEKKHVFSRKLIVCLHIGTVIKWLQSR